MELFKPLLRSYPLVLLSEIQVSEHNIVWGIVCFMWLENIWTTYLSVCQRKVLRSVDKVPVELEKYLSKEKFEKCRKYALHSSAYMLIHGQFELILNTIMVMCQMHSRLWACGTAITVWCGLPTDGYEIWPTYFFMMTSTIFDTITSLPFRMYRVFVLEEKHGFNNQDIRFFAKDEVKKFLLTQAISFPIISGMIYIIKVGGEMFVVYTWIFTTVVLLVIMTIYPSYIAPLFDKYTPLPPGPLKDRIEELAKRLKFPLKNLFVVEGSRRSAHSNAYLYGLFNTKSIVLFDTLIKGYKPVDPPKKDEAAKKKEEEEEAKLSPEERAKKEEAKKEKEARGCEEDEIVAVIGHELGHWKNGHLWKALILLQINTLFAFMVFSHLFQHPTLYRAFGFKDSQPTVAGLIIILGYILMPYKTIMNFGMIILSRHREYEADQFSKSLGMAKPLGQALIKIGVDNLSFPVFNKWYSAWHHSHPTIIERLKALNKED